MPEACTLGAAQLAAQVGLSAEALADMLPDGRLPHPFRHRRLDGDECAAVVRRVERVLAGGTGERAGPERRERWQTGWAEHVAAIAREGFRPELLAPRYFRSDVVRWDGDFILPERASFEADAFAVLRRAIFARHLADVRTVVELGCGTGANLVALTEQFPALRAVGADWADASQALLAEAAAATGRALSGVAFDMFDPRGGAEPPIDGETAVLTVHALEQLGSGFAPLLEWLCARRPRRCVHVEPIVELYDDTHPLDRLAREYHRRRGYLEGFLPALEALAAERRIRLTEVRRVRFGGLFHEAYSLVVWEP
jgi:hypothetical protein